MDTDDIQAAAEREAAAIVAEHGFPPSYDVLVALLAYAYAKGNRAGYAECAEALDAIVTKAEAMGQ